MEDPGGAGEDALRMARDFAADQIANMTRPEMEYARQGVRSFLDEALANARASLREPDVGVAQARRADFGCA